MSKEQIVWIIDIILDIWHKYLPEFAVKGQFYLDQNIIAKLESEV